MADRSQRQDCDADADGDEDDRRAGFYLSVANFLFDAVTTAKRARCVAYYNTLTNIGLVVGAVLGGYIVKHVTNHVVLFGHEFVLTSNLQPCHSHSSTFPATRESASG